MSGNKPFEIKGTRDGLVVHVSPEAAWDEVARQLAGVIDRQRDFFRGARLAIDVGERSVRRQELSLLQHVLADREVSLWAVLSGSLTTLTTARKLGVATTLEASAPGQLSGERLPAGIAETLLRVEEDDGAPPPINPEEVGTIGVLFKRTLRSGRTIHSDGHVVVLGDVNPGAEIIAGGDVIVWGRLRGVVHAGAQGDEGATVCALDMTPMQLRIAGYIATSPKEQRREPRPESARIRGNRIVVEAWN